MKETLRELFHSLELGTQKWDCYFDVYERYFGKFVGRKPVVLEIGVDRGGSLEMWRKWFGEGARIIGVDKKEVEVDGCETVAGNAYEPAFMRDLGHLYGPFDIVLDDGSHKMDHQRLVVEQFFPFVRKGGVLMVEDTHTSYWRGYLGGYRRFGTFMEYAKGLVDELNLYHTTKKDGEVVPPTAVTMNATGIHFHDSMVVIEKGDHPEPKAVINHGKR